MAIFIGWINLVMNGFVVISYVLDPAKRVFPNILSVFIAGPYAMQGLNYAVHRYAHNVDTHSQTEPKSYGDMIIIHTDIYTPLQYNKTQRFHA